MEKQARAVRYSLGNLRQIGGHSVFDLSLVSSSPMIFQILEVEIGDWNHQSELLNFVFFPPFVYLSIPKNMNSFCLCQASSIWSVK